MSQSAIASRARYALFLSVVVTLLLYKIPALYTLAYPLILISTLVHELGHGVAAILAGGTFHKFLMFSDGSGVALWSGNVSGFGRAFISAGGLVGPAVGAALCFVFARRSTTARYCLAIIGVLLIIAEVAVVRNQFGLLFVGILAAVCLFIAIRAGDQVVQISLMFLASQLALSVYARGDYLFSRVAMTGAGPMPSDSEHMARAMGFGSYWFWGFMCAAFSAAVLAFGAWYVLRRRN